MSAVALHHRLDGRDNAPVVVLLGSLGSTLDMWAPQVPALSELFRVVLVDARGHGGSPVPAGPYVIDDLADDLLLLLDLLSVDRAHIVGLSLGAMTAMRFAALHPDRVDRLALLCTTARFDDASVYRERAAAVLAEGMNGIADGVVARWFTEAFRRRHPEVVASYRDMVASTPPVGYAGCCAALEQLDLTADLACIAAPTLVIAAAQDAATPPASLERIAAGLPVATFTVVEGAAHLANVEAAEVVTAAILRHLTPRNAFELEAYERGMATRREVLGDAHVDRAIAATTPLTQPFQDLITRYAWGEVWSRPGLDRRARSMLTLALLTALGHERELRLHVRAAVTNGVTEGEIAEVLLHTAVYAGVPAANTALAVAQEVLDEMKGESALR